MKSARIQDEKGRILIVYEGDKITLAAGTYHALDPIPFGFSITGIGSGKTTLVRKKENKDDVE